MSSVIGKSRRADGLETRARIKVVAQRLFAEHGIDGVSIDQILAAAGQRNKASLHYHFGSKLDLARELVVDGAKLIDESRQAMVDVLEQSNRLTPRDLMEALVVPVLELYSSTGQATYLRMISNLQLNNREFLREALADTWNVGYRRCMNHMAEVVKGVPAEILEQRLSLSSICGNALLAAWEGAQDHESPSKFWEPPFTLGNVLDVLVGVICAPVSPETLQQSAATGTSRASCSQSPSGRSS